MSKRPRSSPWFRTPRSDPQDPSPSEEKDLPTYQDDCRKMFGREAAREMNNTFERGAVVQRHKEYTVEFWTTHPPNFYLENFQESVLQRLDGHCHFCGVLIHSSLQPANFQYSRVSELLTVICPICGYAASFSQMDQVSPRFNEMLKELRAAKKEKG